MTRPSIAQVQAWRPEALGELADEWDDAANRLQAQADTVDEALAGTAATFTGSAAAAARHAIGPTAQALRRVCRALILAATEARDAADVIGRGRERVLGVLADARGDGCAVADDGTVGPPPAPSALLVACSGGADAPARAMLDARAAELTRSLQAALNELGAADAAAARAIDAAFGAGAESTAVRPAGMTPDPVANWPQTSQDGIVGQIAAMSDAGRRRLVEQRPHEVGNTDGVPWDMRLAANRINIANAILDERRHLDAPDEVKLRTAVARMRDPAGAERLWATAHADPALRAATIAAHDRDATRRIAYYQSLLADAPDPLDRDRRVPRQILGFDPQRESLIELSGDLDRARALAVVVPGLNTTFDGSADDVATARRLVAGSGGNVAVISYLGGPFPTGRLLAGIADAADPHYALQMAPRLVAFSEDVERRAGAMPVTYLGHSYGGSIVGTAERLGLTADRVIYVEAAGAGVGVHHPSDWHNRNPDVLRFSITAPGDPIGLVQGIPFGSHGADPDELPGVIRLDAGRRLTGAPMMGPSAHSGVLNEPSDAWRNILAVITGDREHIRVKD
ncbi:alpha/beta hydrolase [Mycobacterium sp. CVI_P3]|uniref:Alpha/beta hydrolase n=1 Tax=Mycobacterium pinniadriaticum TaxID=2994102 RepID=A0ABT3SAL2_9MYCO|nr:alpha/beta hydrolase [Mycobacterium pinniadriaticum]MCX2930375.1 alpha/beta hydrolase [Mycobacterium pinniadriaticum]MCX2936563.1 alpha/beta hydrolase [Mycobacterium pinniadriaticum]